ncbi:MAG: DUF5018 domain-containing protein, partial [Treponema sp.]|nr:DUF5018 domain-containing protein [Treponema sp.]
MKRADGFLYRFRRSPKRFSRAVFALFLSVSAFFAGCDLFNNSMVDYFEDNTGVAEVKGVVPASGIRMMANETVLIPPAVLPGDTTTLTLSLSNPRNFTVRHTLSVVTSDNGIITVDQTGPNKIEIDITGAELDDEYDLTLAMKSPDGLRDFTPYHIPVRCVSFNTALKDLSVDIPGAGAVHPVQKDGAFELNVPAAAAAVTLRAETLEAPYAALSPNNTVPLTSGSSAVEQSLPLVLGMNTFYVKVTAASTDTKVYPVKIFKGDASKAITAFTVTSPVNAAGTITGTAVTVTVPYGTNISALNNASVEIIHTGVKIVSLSPHEERTGSPAGFDSQNLAVPRFYQVMAEDGSAMDYTVTVTEAQNSAKEITEFYFTLNSKKYGAGTGAEAGSGSISGTAINVKVPYKTALTGLAPAVTVSAGALVDPPPGTAKDFTSPQTYTVTAEDGGTGTYTVTVTAAKIASVTAVSGNFTGADGFTQSGGAVSGAAIKAKITSVTGTDSLGTITLDPADYSVDNLTG